LITNGARVRIVVTGQNSYGEATTNTTHAQVATGNQVGESGGWQYTVGNSAASAPQILYKNNVDGTVGVYLYAGTYFNGSVEIIDSMRYTPNNTPTTPIADPSATAVDDSMAIRSNAHFYNPATFESTINAKDT